MEFLDRCRFPAVCFGTRGVARGKAREVCSGTSDRALREETGWKMGVLFCCGVDRTAVKDGGDTQ